MKVSIEYKQQEYILEFNRKTARELSLAIAKLEDSEDVFTQAEHIVMFALKKNHETIPTELRNEIVEFVLNNYKLLDTENDDGTTEKGLLLVLNEMVSELIPKGFTQAATLAYKVCKVVD